MADEEYVEPAQTAPDAQAPTGSFDREVAALTRERDELKERVLRQAAEFDNYRKRVERERRAQAEESVVRLLRELLPVIDDFDLALTVAEGDSGSSYRKGIELIHGKLHELLRKQHVTPIEAVGTQFDPNLHEAVVHEPSETHREGEVISELRKGYMLGDRLLRPSMVKVAQA